MCVAAHRNETILCEWKELHTSKAAFRKGKQRKIVRFSAARFDHKHELTYPTTNVKLTRIFSERFPDSNRTLLIPFWVGLPSPLHVTWNLVVCGITYPTIQCYRITQLMNNFAALIAIPTGGEIFVQCMLNRDNAANVKKKKKPNAIVNSLSSILKFNMEIFLKHSKYNY